jgi:hypothetical protein
MLFIYPCRPRLLWFVAQLYLIIPLPSSIFKPWGVRSLFATYRFWIADFGFWIEEQSQTRKTISPPRYRVKSQALF